MPENAAVQQSPMSGARPLGAAPSNSIIGVQYLRAIACITVVLFHIFGGSEGIFYVGQAGVDIFFLISGFIMWTVTSRREQTPGRFLIRRLIRVVPLYWAITLLVFARRYVLGKATLADLAYSLFFIPHSMSDGTTEPLILPGWTLNYEMFFYLVFAFCLFISVSRRLSVATGVLLALVALGAILDFQLPIAAAYTSPLLLEFLGGAWIGYLNSRIGTRYPAAGLIVLLIGVAAFVVQQLGDFHLVDWRVLAFGVPSAGILIGVLSLERLTPTFQALKELGDASYAIYLVHVPILVLLLRVQMPLIARMLVVLALSISVGAALHFVDLYLNKMLRIRYTPRKPTFISG